MAAYIWQLNRFFDSLKHRYKVPIINRPQMTENELSVILETICSCMNNDTAKGFLIATPLILFQGNSISK